MAEKEFSKLNDLVVNAYFTHSILSGKKKTMMTLDPEQPGEHLMLVQKHGALMLPIARVNILHSIGIEIFIPTKKLVLQGVGVLSRAQAVLIMEGEGFKTESDFWDVFDNDKGIKYLSYTLNGFEILELL